MGRLKNITIIKANTKDHKALTNIAFIAKRHWKYPEEYMEKWKDELTITKNDILRNNIYVARVQDRILGFYSIAKNNEDFWAGEVFIQRGYWLEHIFILPEFHKKGIGSELIKHAIKKCKELKIKRLLVFVDPFARGFYEKVGAKHLYDSKSSIPGRMIPVFVLNIKNLRLGFDKP